MAPSGVELKNPRAAPQYFRSPLHVVQVDGRLVPQGIKHEGNDLWTHESLGLASTLAMWPGNVQHWVPAHQGELPRISVAFNVELSLKSPFDSSWAANDADKRLAEKIKTLL